MRIEVFFSNGKTAIFKNCSYETGDGVIYLVDVKTGKIKVVLSIINVSYIELYDE